MAKKEEKKPLTRAQKTEATKGLIKELLAVKPMRHNELIDEVAASYAARYEGEDTENKNDVKGRVGSVLDIMKKESDVIYDGGLYALKARLPVPPQAKTTRKRTVKAAEKTTPPAEEKEEAQRAPVNEVKEETPAPKKRTRAKKVVAEEVAPEKVVPVEETPAPKKRTRAKKAVAEEKPAAEVVKEVSAPKKRVKKTKAETPAPAVEEKPIEKAEEKAEKAATVEKVEPVVEKKTETPVEVPEKKEKAELVVKAEAPLAPKSAVMDMSFLFGDKSAKPVPVKKERGEEKPPVKVEEKKVPVKAETPKEEKPAAKQADKAPIKTIKWESPRRQNARGKSDKPMTAEEKLKDAFLKRMRVLGGDYFEYYSVYLLERYSMKNGRRLEGLRISGGDHDGGIDGEIELTDKFGFKETIYIQSKNWDPEKGREENWVVGETLLQQFIGACACRQAKDGKQHTRGIFITTSRFTLDAKRILDTMSDRIIGYDGNDLFDAAKECEFGIVKKNGEWALDEKLLAGVKAFFEML